MFGNCSCEENNNQKCNRHDEKFILNFISDYQDKRNVSGKTIFSEPVQSILYNYLEGSKIVVGSRRIIIGVIQEICEVVDAWILWLAIGVLNLIGGILGLVIGCVAVFLKNEQYARVPGIIFLFTSGPSIIMIFFTSAFSSSLVRNFPTLATSAIVLFVFCAPGLHCGIRSLLYSEWETSVKVNTTSDRGQFFAVSKSGVSYTESPQIRNLSTSLVSPRRGFFQISSCDPEWITGPLYDSDS